MKETKESWLRLDKKFEDMAELVFHKFFDLDSANVRENYAEFMKLYLKLTEAVYKELK